MRLINGMKSILIHSDLWEKIISFYFLCFSENESSAYRPNFNLNQINHNFNGVTSPVHDVIAGYSPVMDIRGGVLSLQEIHTAVQATLEELKHENLKVR